MDDLPRSLTMLRPRSGWRRRDTSGVHLAAPPQQTRSQARWAGCGPVTALSPPANEATTSGAQVERSRFPYTILRRTSADRRASRTKWARRAASARRSRSSTRGRAQGSTSRSKRPRNAVRAFEVMTFASCRELVASPPRRPMAAMRLPFPFVIPSPHRRPLGLGQPHRSLTASFVRRDHRTDRARGATLVASNPCLCRLNLQSEFAALGSCPAQMRSPGDNRRCTSRARADARGDP